MKTIYFVRHGESETNAGPVNKGFDAALTEKGRAQAALIAERCAKLPGEVIIASTMPRARDTAVAIQEKMRLPLEYSELFWERRRPSIQYGMAKADPAYDEINGVIYENFLVPGARHSDEENFDDLAVRSTEALRFLAERPEKEIIVATHGVFMRMLAARAILGEQLTGPLALGFMRSLTCKNTGLTVFRYGAKDAHAQWQVITWNDHAHLG